jgi:hypothetical protein
MSKLFAALLLFTVVAQAQEGFPLDGTWRGEHTVAGSPITVVLILQWDGKQIAGMLNPGPDSVQLSVATLNPEGWKVSLVAKTTAGKSITFDGALSELGKYNRVMSGKWTEGGKSFDLRLVRE